MSKRNNSYEGVFRVLGVGQEKVFPSGFRRIEMLVTDDDPKYPQTFPVEFSGDNTDRAAAFQPGDHIAVEFSLRGHTTAAGRAFVTLRGFRVERAVKLGGESHVGQHATSSDVQQRWNHATAPTQPPAPQQPQQQYDELPF